MKLLHIADLHACPERAAEVLQSLTIARRAAQGVDLIVLAGDTWDGVIRNTRGSRFPELLEAIRSLADIAPVALIYGTPTHDAEGSLDVFPTLDSKFGITILEPGKAYFLGSERTIYTGALDSVNYPEALLFGVPEPSKKWLAPYFGTDSESSQAVRDGLRGLFLGLGAIRLQYANLPCVMLYHGQVAGARLQNGDVLDVGLGIRPSIDDLAAVGADYIAMGDIHDPQQVGNLPAYYPGSAYPKDFGETHDAGCNLVEIDGDADEWSRAMTRVSFNHPINQTIRLDLTKHGQEVLERIIPGNRVKLEIRYRKEDPFDADFWLNQLQILGASPGSIVKLDPILTETVRAEEITTVETLEAKAEVWFRQSKKDLSESVRAKIQKIQEETSNPEGQAGPERRFRNVSTLIRGAKGFWKNQKKDEVLIDWESYGPGVIAYIGPNGYGKTTSFDFSKPWPVPVSRPPKTLKNHFRLRDSLIENIYLDEISGIRYKSRITIDAGIASGKTEYYLFRDIGKGYEPMPGIEGRLDGYAEAVESVFGSLEIYMRTAYAAQKATSDRPDISEATKGEKKELIAELAGKDGFAVYQAAAKVRGDEVEASLIPKQAAIDAKVAGLPIRDELDANVRYAEETVEEFKGKLCALLEVGKDKAKKAENLGAQVATQKATAQAIIEAESRAERAEENHAGNVANIKIYQEILNARPDVERTIKEHDALTKALAREDYEYQKYLEAKQAEQAENDKARRVFEDGQRADREAFEALRTAHMEKVRKAQYDKSDAMQADVHAHVAIETIDRNIDRLTNELSKPIADHCPTCRQMLPDENMAHVKNARKEIEDELIKIKSSRPAALERVNNAFEELHRLAQAVVNLEANAPKSQDFQPFTPPLSTLPPWNDANRQTLKTQLSAIDVDHARDIIQSAAQAQVRIEELTKQLDELQSTATLERERANELRAKLRPELDAEYEAAKAELHRYQELYREAQGNMATAQANLNQAKARLIQLDKDLEDIEDMKKALSGLQVDMSEWRLVESAIDGVRDLELDALAPHIAQVATKLLESSGRPGRIEIDTTRMSSGSAKRARQIEDFLIFYVGADGERQDIATCSGGEMVWQRKALYDAFSVIRSRNARIRFTTGLLDETDGALFPEDRVDYFRMLEAGHAESGRYQTILITQAPEIAEMAQTVIDVRDLKGGSYK